ncbi:hypothetical protein KAR10_08960, partial [bacterium]|nr:hypothetical protein [bacterium]
DSANIRLPLNLIKTWDASRESEQDVLRVMKFLGGLDEKKLYKISLHLNDSEQDNYWSVTLGPGPGRHNTIIFQGEDDVEQMISWLSWPNNPFLLRKSGIIKSIKVLTDFNPQSMSADLKYEYELAQGRYPGGVRFKVLEKFLDELPDENKADWFDNYMQANAFTAEEL